MAKTAHGEVRCPVGNVRQIWFAKQGLEEPRRQKGDARVRTAASSFTLGVEKLTGEHLAGNSDYLGQVKLRREAVRSIEFNVHE